MAHRRLATRKLLVAGIGVGAVSYVLACGGETNETSGNLMAPPAADAGADDGAFVSSGNLMAPPPLGPDADLVDGGDGGETDASDDASDAAVDGDVDGG